MPRPNRTRYVGGESSLAERIAFERAARGWSPAGLASRMEQVGCPINTSAIYKLEKADPPRRITVDELIAFARVFDLPPEDLLQPASVVKHEKLRKGLDEVIRTGSLTCARLVATTTTRLRALLDWPKTSATSSTAGQDVCRRYGRDRVHRRHQGARLMASIKRRDNGMWRARYRDESDKEHAKHFERRVDAQRWLDEVTATVVTGQYVDPKAGTNHIRSGSTRTGRSARCGCRPRATTPTARRPRSRSQSTAAEDPPLTCRVLGQGHEHPARSDDDQDAGMSSSVLFSRPR